MVEEIVIKNFEIKFINHASLLIEASSSNARFLTDPWYISPAFGTWYPYPGPKFTDVKDIATSQKELIVTISHGHDDHLDDFFIKNYLSDSQIIIPDRPSKGLYNRVSNCVDKKPIEIARGYSNTIRIKGVEVYNFINKGYPNDSIFVFSNEDEVIVHANDNWHEQPKEIIDQIKKISLNKFIYYFSQVGIASSFPIAFPNISFNEKRNIINQEIERFLSSYQKNIERIKPDLAFTYANQSKIDNDDCLSPYDTVVEKISAHSFIKQVAPGDRIAQRTLIKNKDNSISVFEQLLINAENACNKYIHSKITTNFRVFFMVYKENNPEPKHNQIYFLSDVATWANILSGKLTLETLTIGGNGKIIKIHEENMREVSMFIAEFAYVFQNRLTRNLFSNDSSFKKSLGSE
jgi:hypothetical protein